MAKIWFILVIQRFIIRKSINVIDYIKKARK